MTSLLEAARAIVEGLDHSDFWRADPRTLALRDAILAAEQAPAVVSAEEIADLLESGYDSEEGPTRRWCEEMGRAIVALVAERMAVAVEHAREALIEMGNRVVVQARASEREACARVVEREAVLWLDRFRDGLVGGTVVAGAVKSAATAIRAHTSASEGAQVVPLPGFRCAGCGRVAPDDPRADLAARFYCPECVVKTAPPATERPAGTVRAVPAEEERDFLRAQVTRLRAREAAILQLLTAVDAFRAANQEAER